MPVAVLLACPAIAPVSDTPSTPSIESVSNLLTARANWEQANPKHYRFVYRRRCYCPTPNDVLIEVKDDRVVSVQTMDNGSPIPQQRFQDYPTIAQLLSQIDRAVVAHPDSILVEYDRSQGYPKRVRIDFSYRAADDEIDYMIQQVEILAR